MTETFEYKVFNSPRARGVELARKMRYDLATIRTILTLYANGNGPVSKALALAVVASARIEYCDVLSHVIEAVEKDR